MRLLLCSLALLLLPTAQADQIKVAVAANFKATLVTLANAFEAESGHRLLISSAATGVLYTQITQGAPFDLFLSADSATARRLEEQGLGQGRFTYAYGRLGLWRRGGPAPDAQTLRHWQGPLVIANPRLAPYGAAALATLTHFGIDPSQYRLLTGNNIGQAWQFIASGNATLGFVAWSSLVAAGKTQEAWAVPTDAYPPIEQQGVIVGGGQACTALVAWLQSRRGRDLIAAAGYGLPEAR